MNPLEKFIRRQWAAEKISLDGIAAMQLQKRFLFFGFHTFGKCYETQTVRELDNRADYHPTAFVRTNIHHKRPVDLEDIQGEAFKLGHAGIAGPEIIERQSHPDTFQYLKHAIGGFNILGK